MGTPEFAVPALRSVARACEVAAVVTPPDRKRGRGLEVQPCAVAVEAAKLGLALMQPSDVRAPDSRATLARLGADLFAVVAFGTILTLELLRTPRLGCINLHGSLLPDYRGASPVQRALWEGRASTGVTTLWMDEGVDTGDLIAQRWMPIESDDDAASLVTRLAELGGPLLAESLTLAFEGRAKRVRQDLAAGSYARKLAKSDGMVDWACDAVTVWNRQRAVTPWPGATTGFRGKRLLLARTRPLHGMPVSEAAGTALAADAEGVTVACAPGALRLVRVRSEGRAELGAAEWARGARLEPGERFELAKETTV